MSRVAIFACARNARVLSYETHQFDSKIPTSTRCLPNEHHPVRKSRLQRLQMIGKKLKNPPTTRKRDRVIKFLRDIFLKGPVATMPDPGLERCSSCFFPTEFHKVPLIAEREYNYDSKILTFGLPEGVSLDLPVCSCLLVQVSTFVCACKSVSLLHPVSLCVYVEVCVCVCVCTHVCRWSWSQSRTRTRCARFTVGSSRGGGRRMNNAGL